MAIRLRMLHAKRLPDTGFDQILILLVNGE
jgi:hypothetical protein